MWSRAPIALRLARAAVPCAALTLWPQRRGGDGRARLDGFGGDRAVHFDFDAVVVGGGVCGLCAALALRRAQYTVLLLEREAVGAETQASSINCGFCFVADADPSEAAPDALDGALAAASRDIYRDLAAAGHDLEYRECGMLAVAATDAEMALARTFGHRRPAQVLGGGAAAEGPDDDNDNDNDDLPALARQQRHHPEACVLLTAAEALAVEPALGSVSGAVLYPRALSVHPHKAVLALRAEAVRAGVVVREGTEAVAVARDGAQSWAVASRALEGRLDDAGAALPPVRTKAVVLANGGWVPHLAGGALASLDAADATPAPGVPVLGVVPVLANMFATAPDGGGADAGLRHMVYALESEAAWAGPAGEGDGHANPPHVTHRRAGPGFGQWAPRSARHLYGKRTHDGRYLFGGDRRVHPAHRPGLVHSVPRPADAGANTAVCRAHAAEVVPCVAELPVEREWAGIMPFSLDGVPTLGRVANGLYVATGLGGSGMKRGPAAGRLVGLMAAEDLGHGTCARPPKWLERADPKRWLRG